MPGVDSLKGRSVVVTGASGFVGAHLVRRLLADGARVVALSRQKEPARLRGLAVPVAGCDVTMTEQLCAVFRQHRPEIVFHLAAYGVHVRERDAVLAKAVNVGGAIAVVEAAAAAEVRQVVHVGTSHEYGGSDKPLTEDASLKPAGIYGSSKAEGLTLARSRGRALGLRWIGLRLFVAYGPGEDEDKLIPYLITRTLRREPVVTTAGDQVRDFVFVDDLARGIALAAAADLPDGEVLNLGSGRGTRLAQVFDLLTTQLPGMQLRRDRPLRDDDVMCQVADTSWQQRLLPAWRAAVPLDEGLKRTTDWYRERAVTG